MLTQKSQITTFSEDMTVAVVGRHKNYAYSLCELLKGLGVTVSCYQDEEDFFAQSKKTNRFNAVFAVSCQNNGLVLKLTRSIKDQYDSQQMPLIWLTCYNDLVRDPSVYLMQNGLSEFHVYQALEYASQRKPIAPLSFHYQGVAWILVGGSRVQKAVLKTHLTHCSLASQSYDDLSDYEGVFSYYTKAVVVLLDEQDDSVLSDIKRRFPDIVLVSLQERHSFSPSLVTTFELNYPYSLDEVKELADHINQYITEN